VVRKFSRRRKKELLHRHGIMINKLAASLSKLRIILHPKIPRHACFLPCREMRGAAVGNVRRDLLSQECFMLSQEGSPLLFLGCHNPHLQFVLIILGRKH
jgi:hypothetical protein